MLVADLLNQMNCYKDQPAMIFKGQSYNYGWLHDRILYHSDNFKWQGVLPGCVVELVADYNPESLAIFFALLNASVIVMPLTNMPLEKQVEYEKVVEPELRISVDADQVIQEDSTGLMNAHPILAELQKKAHPGLIIMSSGSTGKSKAIVHDFLPLLKGLKQSSKRFKVISFLLFDHIGGINAVLSSVYSGNCLVVPDDRTPKAIAACIENYQVDVLITSPSFLNLMSLSGVLNTHDLSNLKQVNYGSEVMPQSLLERLNERLPSVRFNQAYGLSELGVIKTRSTGRNKNSIKIEDENIQYRVCEGRLEIKSHSSMLGYLNAPSPFTEDGWFMTGDAVEETDGEIRILGRDSEIINVGGEKVFPAEIEAVLMELPEVEDAVVVGEKNAILGNMVIAKIKLKPEFSQKEFSQTARKFCLTRLPAFKVPQKFCFISHVVYGERFKKNRNLTT